MPSPRSRPPWKHRARGDILRQGLTTIRLLHEAPRRPGDLAVALGCSRRTVERILNALQTTDGLQLVVERSGREAWYRITAGPFTRLLTKKRGG